MNTKTTLLAASVCALSLALSGCAYDHEDSKEKKVGQDPKRFTFSYFNNMDFHTEFVRRFYKQMVFESVKQLENKLP